MGVSKVKKLAIRIVMFLVLTGFGSLLTTGRLMPGAAAAAQTPIDFNGAPSVSDPTNCSLYSGAPRWFLESQAWWRDPGEEYLEQGHIHLGTCFPHMETISGTITFDVIIKVHKFEHPLTELRVQIFEEGVAQGCTGGVATTCYTFPTPPVCSTEDCVYRVRLDVPTTGATYNGIREFRFSVFADMPGGKQLYQSTGWRARLNNPGKIVQDYDTRDMIEARGWHTNTKYTNARFYNSGDANNPNPLKNPVSGLWKVKARFFPGSDSAAVTEYEIRVDPNIHAGAPDYVIDVGSDPSGDLTVTIDTRKLANGAHKLFLRAGAKVWTTASPPVLIGTNSGVLVIPFKVQN